MCSSDNQHLFIPHAIFQYMKSCDPCVWPRDKYRHHTGAHRTAALIQHHGRIRVCVLCFFWEKWCLHRQRPFISSRCCEIAFVQSRPPWLQSGDAGSGVYSGDVGPVHELVCTGYWSSGLASASCAGRPRLNSRRCWVPRRKFSVS